VTGASRFLTGLVTRFGGDRWIGGSQFTDQGWATVNLALSALEGSSARVSGRIGVDAEHGVVRGDLRELCQRGPPVDAAARFGMIPAANAVAVARFCRRAKRFG
jgi:hypothetical protein